MCFVYVLSYFSNFTLVSTFLQMLASVLQVWFSSVEQTDCANAITAGDKYIFVGCANGLVRIFNVATLGFVTSMPAPHYLGVDVAAEIAPRCVLVDWCFFAVYFLVWYLWKCTFERDQKTILWCMWWFTCICVVIVFFCNIWWAH